MSGYGQRLGLALLLLPLMTVAVADQPAAPDVAPVAIFKPLPRTPDETAGAMAAPAVEVRVTVDPRGNVSRVEVVRIEPSTEFDDLFRQAAIEGIGDWRYAPALLDGQPVEAALSWTIQFPSLAEQQEQDDRAPRPGASPIHVQMAETKERLERRWSIVAMDPEARGKIQLATAEIAEKFLDPRQRRSFATPGFFVVTDAPSADVARAVAGNMEAVLAVIQGLWAGKIPAQPGFGKVLVDVFANESSFHLFRSRVVGYEWAAGFYSAEGLIALHMQVASNEDLLSLMLHEASHAFVDRHLVRPGSSVPLWLDEGLAEYVGNSQIRRKELIPGKYRRRQVYNGPWGSTVRSSIAMRDATAVKQAMKKGEALSLAELVSARHDEFYGEKRPLFYTESWMLVHFLRHGGKTWATDEFPLFMLYVAEGHPASAALERAYGRPAQQLDPEFEKYVRDF